ncbi:MAG: HAMP domain-containing protein [Deltaproteobacteria bacterium]|nr:HAMP domain-containing protein [Deltaproteobacteria bacterium]
MGLTIQRKLLLSYLFMALLTVVASAYAIFSLQNLNEHAQAIVDRDFSLLETSKKMMDALMAQENAEKKYLILKDASIAEIFWSRSQEFNGGLETLKNIPFSGTTHALSQVSVLHDRYDEMFRNAMVLVGNARVEEAVVISESDGRKIVDDMAALLRVIHKNVENDIDSKMNLMKSQGLEASRMTFTLSIISLLVGLVMALIITYNISRPLKELKKATGMIADGQFDYNLSINRRDEIGALADAFGFMTERLKVLERLLLDASPLTGLPGNIAIEQEIGKRLSEKKGFSLCHVDLDNFKPFADKYGYAWGSEVIKEVANILVDNVHISTQEGEFIGHIGGDDFVIIAEPRRAELICRDVIREFDRRSERFYSEKDREKRFIVGRDRSGSQQKFPLITMTIAIVTDDGTRYQDPLEMAKKAAELKEYAKTLQGSNYVRQEDVEKMA